MFCLCSSLLIGVDLNCNSLRVYMASTIYRAAIFVREVDILIVIEILTKVSHKRITELRDHGAWLYTRYFKSMKAITKTTLEIIADRVFSHLARDSLFWNVPAHLVRIYSSSFLDGLEIITIVRIVLFRTERHIF